MTAALPPGPFEGGMLGFTPDDVSRLLGAKRKHDSLKSEN
jgi:hypothetical protein